MKSLPITSHGILPFSLGSHHTKTGVLVLMQMKPLTKRQQAIAERNQAAAILTSCSRSLEPQTPHDVCSQYPIPEALRTYIWPCARAGLEGVLVLSV